MLTFTAEDADCGADVMVAEVTGCCYGARAGLVVTDEEEDAC